MKHYLLMEVEGIQRFVFAPTRLRIIRGGSAMLDRFNRVEMLDAVKRGGGEVVFAGGGHCLAQRLDRAAAEEIGRALERSIRRQTDSQAGLAWGIAPEDGDWRTVVRPALGRDIERRALGMHAVEPSLPPFVALCSSCGVSPARALEDMKERVLKPLCGACRARRRAVDAGYRIEPQTVWDRLRPHLRGHEHPGDDDAFHELLPEGELEQLAELGSASGRKYLAYLYCDGNSMGEKLRSCRTAGEYGELSRRIDSALHGAVAAALCEHCRPERSGGKFGAEVLMLGGDDLIVALPADRGAAFTARVLEGFHEATSRELRLSAGLVFAPHSTPITILQKTARHLLKSAKRLAYLEERQSARRKETGRTAEQTRLLHEESGAPREPAVGYVDFQELTSSQADIQRSDDVTCRPYRLDDFRTLVKRVGDVKRATVPRGRLHALVEALNGSEREAHTMTKLVVGRARKTVGGDQRAVLSALLRPFEPADTKAPVPPYATTGDERPDLAFDLYDKAHRWSAVPDALELIDHIGSEGP